MRGVSNRYSRKRWAMPTLWERFNGMCALCGMPVPNPQEYVREDVTGRVSNALSASADHILSLSQGGDDTEENLQLTHFSCNLRKNRYTAKSKIWYARRLIAQLASELSFHDHHVSLPQSVPGWYGD